jgi:SAM-dependent methyltransferase
MSSSNSAGSKRLNIGCGRCYHSGWVNLDLNHPDPSVIQHDIIQGVPFGENGFDVVYHSHVLEHLAPEEGAVLIRECYRVLRPGGILRIVVPDLEQIARLYLQQHELACQGDPRAIANYDWMKLELIDQMVRRNSGGKMGQFITSPMISNPDFVISRLGNEFDQCLSATRQSGALASVELPVKGIRSRLERRIFRIRKWSEHCRFRLALKVIRVLLGKKMQRAFEEGVFRSEGEIHRWMYDFHSLNQLCRQSGFVDCVAKTAFESQIESFEQFHLDVVNGKVRKPDSLFFECRKPGEVDEGRENVPPGPQAMVYRRNKNVAA